MKIIELQNLTKTFENKTAVDNLNFGIESGEIFGLLGVNGAGKTTTIRMLTMQTRPTSGKFFYYDDSNEQKIIDEPKKILSMIGIVPQHLNFDQDLTVLENLELHARLHHVKNFSERIENLLTYVDLKSVANNNVKKLSGGMKRRLLIIRALIHEPRILFLDEPTVALDPQVRRKIWQSIREMSDRGTTVILTTHYIEEAETLCNRVAILDAGKLIALDSPKNLCTKFELDTLEEVFLKLTGKTA